MPKYDGRIRHCLVSMSGRDQPPLCKLAELKGLLHINKFGGNREVRNQPGMGFDILIAVVSSLRA